jgi:beta-lactamase class A
MRSFASAVLAAALLGAASPSPSASTAPLDRAAGVELARSRLETLFRTQHADPSWFAQSFLDQVPASEVDAGVAALEKQLGPYQSLEFTPQKFIAHFAKGTDDVLIHLDADGKIDGLLLRPPVMTTSSLEEGLRALRALPGTLSYVILEGRSQRAALNPSQVLAVGSAFKLAVLSALRDQIVLRKRRWSDVVPLRAQWKSLPSGSLQTWPDGTPITLASYAAQMISVSDNTAADALIGILGRQAIAPYADGNVPFLTTREVVVLHAEPNADLRAAYLAAATPQMRASVLRRADARPLPTAMQLGASPVLAIEWRYNVRQLCGLIERVADLPLMSINVGQAQRGDFRQVAYKGGSDVGVINMTTIVTTKRGARLCFAATLNNPQGAVDESAFGLAYSGVLHSLAVL